MSRPKAASEQGLALLAEPGSFLAPPHHDDQLQEMATSQVDGIKQEHADNASVAEPVPPSFKGRLNLADYTFSPQIEPLRPLRQSPRTVQPSSKNSTRNAGTSPLKRSSSTDISPSQSPRKKSRSPSGYAPPTTYAHLPELRDVLAPNLICVFIGLNPGIQTAVQGHAYAHPSNRFWKLLYSSGCTTRLCRPEEDGDLPKLFELGNTNIVSRPTRNGSELSKKEMDDSVQILEEKIARSRPEAVCIVGKSIWESVFRVRHGRGIRKEEFRYGWQDGEMMGVVGEGEERWAGARIFVASSTSGLAATLLPAEKERIWRELGVWVEQRRKERSAVGNPHFSPI